MAELMPLLQALQHHGHASPSFTSSDPQLQKALRHLTSLLRILPSQFHPKEDVREEKEEEEARPSVSTGVVVVHTEDRHAKFTPSQLDYILDLTEAVIVRFLHVPLEAGLSEPIESVFVTTVEVCVKALKIFSNLTLTNDDAVFAKILHIIELAFEVTDKESIDSAANLSREAHQGLEEVLQTLDISESVDVSFPKDIRGCQLRDGNFICFTMYATVVLKEAYYHLESRQ